MPIKYAKNNNGKDCLRGYIKEDDSFPIVQLTRNQCTWIIENLSIIKSFSKESPNNDNNKLTKYNL
jgi:hypothetical protein